MKTVHGTEVEGRLVGCGARISNGRDYQLRIRISGHSKIAAVASSKHELGGNYWTPKHHV